MLRKREPQTTEGKADNKRRPIEERIAEMLVRGAFRDVWQGCGGWRPSINQMAGMLGFVQRQHGKIAPMVLETHYGGSLMHLHTILRSWEHRESPGPMPHEITVRMRLAGEMAVRELAGYRYSRVEIEHLAWLGAMTRSSLDRRLRDAAGWLEGIRGATVSALAQQLANEARRN